jgi:hypothetical protein
MLNRRLTQLISTCGVAFALLCLLGPQGIADTEPVKVLSTYDVLDEYIRFAEVLAQKLAPEKVRAAAAKGKASDVTRSYLTTVPLMLDLGDEHGNIVGGVTELLPNVDVFITARHVLQQRDPRVLRAYFGRYGKITDQFRFYGMSLAGKPLDAVLMVPKGLESQIFEYTMASSPCQTGNGVSIRLKPFANIQRPVEAGFPYFACQFGTSQSHATAQVSVGKISRVGNDRLYLEVTEDNHTSPRSSGSIVFVRKSIRTRPKDNLWRVGGIVECLMPARKSESGATIPAEVRVISSSALLNADLKLETLESIAAETRPSDPNCVPIDSGRDGGGK